MKRLNSKSGCAVEVTLSVMGGTWKPIILFQLLHGKKRFGELSRAIPGITQRMLPRKRSVGELLGVVLALSSRTRRMVQAPVAIDLDVFAPGGARAIRLTLGRD